jgi:DNA-binding transcriptional LysR family regulator
VNLLSAMRAFCNVVEHRGFTAAARRLESSPAAVSRQVSALEKHLGIRLLNRSTRQVELSEAGAAYYPRCLELIDQLDSLESEVGGFGTRPRGLLRLSVPMDFGQLFLRPAIREFISLCPDVRLEVHFEDRRVRLLEEQLDLAIRISRLADSTMVSRRLGQACIGCYASPDYLAQHGEPERPEDLVDHHVLEYALSATPGKWRFETAQGSFDVPVRWQLSANNGRALASNAARGLGIIRMPEFLVQDHLAAGSLLEVLAAFRSAPLDISVVYLHRKFKPAKITAFVEFLVEYFRNKGDWLPVAV